MSPRIRSETRAWDKVRQIADGIRRSTAGQRARGLDAEGIKDAGQVLYELANEMLAQLDRGVHENPATLAVWGNPPVGSEQKIYFDQPIGFRVHDIRYEHVDDRQYYKHTFASGVEMWSVLRGARASTREQHQDVLLTRPDGRTLWDDFF